MKRTMSPTAPAVPRLGDSWWMSSADGSYRHSEPSALSAQAVVDVVQIDPERLVELTLALERLRRVARQAPVTPAHSLVVTAIAR